jgi:hypothetical protein
MNIFSRFPPLSVFIKICSIWLNPTRFASSYFVVTPSPSADNIVVTSPDPYTASILIYIYSITLKSWTICRGELISPKENVTASKTANII